MLYHTAIEEKIPLLVHLLRHMDPTRSLVFTNTKDAAEACLAWLKGNGLNAAVLSGDVPQNKRLKIAARFHGRPLAGAGGDRRGRARSAHPGRVAMCSISICRRTPRTTCTASAAPRASVPVGDAVSFACERFVFSLPEIEAYIGHKIPVEPVPEDIIR